MINFENVKQNFFVDYSKYWITFFVILAIYFLNDYRIYHFKTDKIPGKIENAVYVGNGVAINKHNVIVSKELIDQLCIDKYSGLRNNIFVVDKENTIPVVVIGSNSILDIAILGTKKNEDTLKSFALFAINDFGHSVNDKVIVPKTLNRGGYFSFKNSKILNIDNLSNFFISEKKKIGENTLLGTPIFNKNYILLGVTKDIGNNASRGTDDTYFINGLRPIKNFLNSVRIPYFMISGNFTLASENYATKDSVVNIICIKKY